MDIENLVLGVLDTADYFQNPTMGAKLRNFTISWSRYSYPGLILLNKTINGILDEAADLGYKYCLIQADGHVISENWYPKHLGKAGFQHALKDWIANRDFFVTGHIIDGGEAGFGLDEQCLLVNLEAYEKFGRPAFGHADQDPISLIKPERSPEPNPDAAGPLWLAPTEETQVCAPRLSGWGLIDASLRQGKTVYNFDEVICSHKLYLRTDVESQAKAFASYFDQGIFRYRPEEADAALSRDHKTFLDAIERPINNSKRGVFLWNVEAYSDVEVPPTGFTPPLSALHSVAAGFKPNRILHTHGFDERTKVIFFDYSPNALAVKKLLHEEWDGEDYPSFVRYILKKFPYPETYYHLWTGVSPDNLDWKDVDQYWREELSKWGGGKIFKAHWTEYKKLKHDYVHCDILAEQSKLLEHIDPRPNAVIWWSNAFFTFYSNWIHTADERKDIYDGWVRKLAAHNPDIFLYGSDSNNVSVNYIQARPYLDRYSELGGSHLNPVKLHKHALRF